MAAFVVTVWVARTAVRAHASPDAGQRLLTISSFMLGQVCTPHVFQRLLLGVRQRLLMPSATASSRPKQCLSLRLPLASSIQGWFSQKFCVPNRPPVLKQLRI